MMDNTRSQPDLTVKGESVERIYGNFQDKRYIVNRRYQRKLVWTLEEKKKFIDSIAKGYPVPIVLLAENKTEDRSMFEIIDGMQRLNAIMGFLENEYPINGSFFDLNTMADTKALMDSGLLTQREPILPRNICVQIASYTVPLSIYEFSKNDEVDEVFRRINSGGRKLSRQELRIAGSTGHFANVVRKIASKVRGDVSATDNLLLNEMKKISITNKELAYGIDVDEVFWIKQGVLTKEQVRESRDEEVIADILSYILLDSPPSSRTEFLDDYFGFGEGEASKQRLEAIERAVQKHTLESVTSDFQRVLDDLKITLLKAGQSFGQLLFGAQTSRAPRYFQVVFLAFHQLIVKDNKEIADHDKLIYLLKGSKEYIKITEGGRWGSQDRINSVNSVVGLFSPAFRQAQAYDPAQVRWITQLENILTQSYTEQGAYDFKQGLLRLDGSNKFDEASFEKIMKTLVGIANIKRNTKGYVIIGVVDKEADARRIHNLFGVSARSFGQFFITGIEHEAKSMNKTPDQLFQLITDKIKQSKISEPLRDYVARHTFPVKYYDKLLVILEAHSQSDPSHYAGIYLTRYGNELKEIAPENFGDLFRRFQLGL